ncbi:EamA family transporter [bacterium]|nr:EamA family transporter [bacterium]
MKQILFHWQFWALLSAFFASLTAIFAKIGIRNINSDFAVFIRTIIILIFTTMFLLVTKQFQSIRAVTSKNVVFLVLSGAALL